MRVFGAALILMISAYFADQLFAQGKYFSHLSSMAQSIARGFGLRW